MKDSLLQYLACPGCQGDLSLRVSGQADGEILEGALSCRRCAESYPVVRGIPRFVGHDHYVGSFSFQWNVHRTTQVDSLAGHTESRKTFATKTGLTEVELRGRLVLDAGCGTGRFMEVAAEMGAEVIGVDLSYAVDAAFTNMGRRPRIHVVQADLFRLPFRPATFGTIYSIGVLHHTPDTRQAFRSLTPLLKPGGLIAIWVYVQAGEYSRRLDRMRRLASRLPRRLLYALCWIWVPLLNAFRFIPVLHLIPKWCPVSNQGRGVAWDVMDTFDAYSPVYQWKHTEPEVHGWFTEAGLDDIRLLEFPVSVLGRRSDWSGTKPAETCSPRST